MASPVKKLVSDELLEILACPVCRTGVTVTDHPVEDSGLKCGTCGRIYPVKNGIPVMLESEAVSDVPSGRGGS